jgi:flagellar basal-body rod protein FlgB
MLGISAQALALRGKRMELLTANIANANTPGYKARDIDFAAAMRSAEGEQAGLRVTNARHMGGSGGADSVEAMYRVPSQPSLDGNTVESQREHAAFMDNAMRYQASLNFLDSRIRSLKTAISGQAG